MQEQLILLWFLHGTILLVVSALLFYTGKIKQEIKLLRSLLQEHDHFTENRFLVLEDKIQDFINVDDQVLINKIIGKQ